MPFDRETVAVAHTADLDANLNLTPALAPVRRARTSSSWPPARTTCTARIFAIAASQLARDAARRRSTEGGVTGCGISTPGPD